jgi:uncharacterized protein YjbI with pentapeptide repeats
MVNLNHVKLLVSGVENWNNWRNENPDEKPDLTGTDLQAINLSNADLTYCNLSGANLRSAYLIGARLSYANLSKANLRGAYIIGADLSNADLEDCNLKNANISNSSIIQSNLKDANFSRTDLSSSYIDRCDLTQCNFTKSILFSVNFSNCIFTGVTVEQWFIDDKTAFRNIECDYVNLKLKMRFPKERNFESGEFESIFSINGNEFEVILNQKLNLESVIRNVENVCEMFNIEFRSLTIVDNNLSKLKFLCKGQEKHSDKIREILSAEM